MSPDFCTPGVDRYDTCQSSSFERLPLDHETVHTLFNSMDSERDRRVGRVLLGANRSTKELFQLGIDSMKNMSNLIEQVTTVAKEVKNANLAAEDLLILHYKDMLKQIESKLEKNEKRLSVKEKEWSKSQVMDLEDSIDMLKDKQDDINNLLQQSTPSWYCLIFLQPPPPPPAPQPIINERSLFESLEQIQRNTNERGKPRGGGGGGGSTV